MNLSLRRVALVFAATAFSAPIYVFGLVSLAAALLATSVADVSTFDRISTNISNLALTSSVFFAPIAAGAAAMRAQETKRLGLSELFSTTVRGNLASEIVQVAAVWFWSVVSITGASFVALLRVQPIDPFPLTALLLQLQACSLCLLAAIFGYVGGKLWSARAAAVFVSAVVFVVIYILSYVTGSFSVLSVIYPDVFYAIYMVPNVSLLLGQTSLIIATGAALIWVTHTGGGSRLRLVASLTAVGILGGLFLLIPQDVEPVQVRSSPSGEVCDKTEKVKLCVWPQYSAYLAASLEALDDTFTIASEYWEVPTTYRQPGVTAEAGSKVFDVPVSAVGEADFHFQAVREIVPCLDRIEKSTPTVQDAAGDVTEWLDGKVSPSTLYPSEVKDVIDTGGPSEKEWVEDRVNILQSCASP